MIFCKNKVNHKRIVYNQYMQTPTWFFQKWYKEYVKNLSGQELKQLRQDMSELLPFQL